MCTRCRETFLRRQENIGWFLSVSRGRDSEPPTLRDASCSDRREMLCQHCWRKECRVTTKVCQLPWTLILQLNRYVFLGDEPGRSAPKSASPSSSRSTST